MNEKTIAGVHFRVAKLGFRQARALFLSVSKALGPSLGALADGSAADMPAVLGKALSAVLEGVDERTLEQWTDTLGSVTQFSREGTKWPFLTAENREELFRGHVFSLYFPWLLFALESQFSDFSAALAALRGPGPERDTTTDSGA